MSNIKYLNIISYITKQFLSLIIFLLFALFSCAKEKIKISANNPDIHYSGRVGEIGDTAKIIYWSGTSIKINFEGNEIGITLEDNFAKNYFYVLIDNKIVDKLNPDSVIKTYYYSASFTSTKHTFELYKLTECTQGATYFYGFELDKNAKVLPLSESPTRKMEFYGNSITCGYSLEDTKGDSGNPEFENNFYSYAALTARHFNADFHCISKSGIGLMISWFPIIMPELYDRLNPEDSTSKWDFTIYQPNIVVINLLQNDSWLLQKPDFPQYKMRFGINYPSGKDIILSYKKFVETIKNNYPKATIICALGSMNAANPDLPWMGYIDSAVRIMNDSNIYTLRFPYNQLKTHPKRKDHEAMADTLIHFIDKHVKWNK